MSSSSQKPRIQDIIDVAESSDAEHPSSGSESGDPDQTSQPTEQDATGSSSKKKKKKKKSKAAKALNALKGKKELPQELVDRVLEGVTAEHGENSPAANEEAVRQALEQLKVMDMLKGKAGLGGRGKKAMGEHKFWATQPVPQLGEGAPEEDGCIEPSRPREEVRQDPYPIPKEFEWSVLDINDPKEIKEVYDLLSLNYVEDDDASFRFQYSAEFLEWALKPPGYHKEWHIGVRVASNKKLVAFISGVPITLRIRGNIVKASEINYLCIHKKLRAKRLAPVLIKEITRQCHLLGVFQAIYTAGAILPTPVSTCRYYHRLLNVSKLVDVKFTYVPRNMTLARMIRLYKIGLSPSIPGLREMEEKDVAQVADLFTRYMERFPMVPEMTIEEARHQFLSGRGDTSPSSATFRRPRQVVWTYVVEDPETHKITDFFSFYSLPSTIIGNTKHNLLEAAYLFYYASDVAFGSGADDDVLKKRLEKLVGDALIIANEAKFDVFNALTLMDNVNFLEDLKFGAGDGLLNFYLYNWRTAPLAGVTAIDGVSAGKGVGVVML
ncbi:N-myristoyl transferase [Coniophora puteana RWD-64-598 SS2]|uniref:Glycylpeptide N-tetradecanoyltransferase n=1 Tax=Coniophora puteana (strain RWD-64-598) TaxID=741705 RepID=A0A5M3N0Z8_CONPW|nr:N-myristoyl transferase [Coniophora puteana RWD-64-598 SS2]EIW85083.1 N-myristoyl transferase [Coniophora puteana RWD-64-598 SS2]